MGLRATIAAIADRVAAAAWVGPSLRAARPHRLVLDAPSMFAPPVMLTPQYDVAWCSSFADQTIDVHWADATARLFVHQRPARTTIMLVHGYLGGYYRLEERIWAARELYGCGFDLAIATLPHHGVRATLGPPAFPCADPTATIANVRQSIHELRGLLRILQARGAQTVGAMGMSLGGYLVALLATLEPQLGFAVPIVPLSDLTDFASGVVPNPRTRAEAATDADVLAITSPLSRPSRIAANRMLVVGAENDRIAPLSHAEELADHLGAELEVSGGGHFLQQGRDIARDWIGRSPCA